MLTTDDAITADEIRALLPVSRKRSPTATELADTSTPYLDAKRKVVGEFTTAYLKTQLSIHGGNITKAAEASKIQRHYFSQLIKRYLNREG
jgi:DNA-binding NtrC family response regulator